GRNALSRIENKLEYLENVYELSGSKGKIILAETIPYNSPRLSSVLLTVIEDMSESNKTEMELISILKKSEKIIYESQENPITNWNEKSLVDWIESAGYKNVSLSKKKYHEQRVITEKDIINWLNPERSPFSYGNIILKLNDSNKLNQIKSLLLKHLLNKPTDWDSTVCFVNGNQ
ncbi:MAG: hypothetical protein KAH95_04505, partial [Spirochaetales bacterium]|nr:hypothetical protein [Spirochaetales bacterium]